MDAAGPFPEIAAVLIALLEVRDLIRHDSTLLAVETFVSENSRSDAAHDIGHALRVATWAIRIGGSAVDRRLAIVAALLHDVVNVPKNHPDRSRASERSADVAQTLMRQLGFDGADVALVADAIRDHSFTRGATPVSPLGKALQDADRLEALGVIGTFRCIATGATFGAELFDADDPWAEARPLDDKRYSVDHFFVKLFKLPETFQTEPGRCEAERRVEVMRGLLKQLATEIASPENCRGA
jgi:uncharacterized protein